MYAPRPLNRGSRQQRWKVRAFRKKYPKSSYSKAPRRRRMARRTITRAYRRYRKGRVLSHRRTYRYKK